MPAVRHKGNPPSPMTESAPADPAPLDHALPGAVITYISQNFDIGGSLVGRQSASEGFLRAYVAHSGLDRFMCLSTAASEIDTFRNFVTRHGPPGARAEGLLPPEMPRIGEVGTLFRPGPDLGFFAWLRRALGQRGFSICGVNHTLSDEPAMRAIGRLITAPVQEWDALICTSTASKQAVERLLDEYAVYFGQLTGTELRSRAQLPLIPLGVDCDAFDPPEGRAAARAAVRAQLGIPEDDMVLLYFGRFNHVEKASPVGMYVAAEQAAQQLGRRLRLLQVGWFPSPEMERGFRHTAETLAPSVEHQFVDGRPMENRRAWFAADIFITLTENLQESFGLTPIEAMAAGLPVVVSDWDGYRDTVRDGIDGYRIPTAAPPPGLGDALAFIYASGYAAHDLMVGAASQSTAVHPGAAAAALVRLIQDDELRRRMGAAGRARAREAFDWPVIVRAYQRLWAELAEIRKTAPEVAPPEPGRAARPLAMDPFSLFREFPTTPLLPAVRIILTPAVDAAIAQGMLRLPIAAPVRMVLLGDEGLSRLVAALQEGPATIHDLIESFGPGQRHAAWLTIGWLCKTGLARWE